MWIVVALAVFLNLASLTALKRPFDAEWHAWASANVMTIARSYAEHGVLALHGLPIANNPPLGRSPDVYTHWPPLFPLLLAGLFRLLGESEAVARGLALAVSVALAVCLFRLVKSCCGPRAAQYSLLGLLTLPAFFIFNRLVLGLNLAITGALLALLAFVRASESGRLKRTWAIIGVAALALGVAASWEALLTPLSLIVMALLQRHRARTRLASIYLLTGTLTVLVVIGLYAINAPAMVRDLWHTVLYRIGFGYAQAATAPLHALPNQLYYVQEPSFAAVLKAFWAQVWLLLGPVPLALLVAALFLVGRNRNTVELGRQATLLVGTLAPWVAWHVVMWNQAYDNHFQMLLGAPPVAVSVSIVGAAIERRRQTGDARRWWSLAVLIVVASLLYPLVRYASESRKPEPRTGLLDFATDIRQSTEPEAIVLVPQPSMVPVYYSRRHLLRCAWNDRAAGVLLPQIDQAFPGSPVYFALYPESLESFENAVQLFPVVKTTPWLVLLKVGVAGEGRMQHAADTLAERMARHQGPVTPPAR